MKADLVQLTRNSGLWKAVQEAKSSAKVDKGKGQYVYGESPPHAVDAKLYAKFIGYLYTPRKYTIFVFTS